MNDLSLSFPLHEQREPTLAQRLRYIDLCLECAAEAKAEFPAPMSGFAATDDALPPSNPAFGPAYRFLRIKRMREEGLPLSLIGDQRTAAERHQERMSELAGNDWDRSKLNLTPVRAGDVA